MNKILKKILLWILALIFVLGARTYQKYTGPTYPKREKITLGAKDYKFKLLRSHGGDENCIFPIVLNNNIKGKFYYRLYPTANKFKAVEMEHSGDSLFIELPHQPPAGKLEYYVELYNEDESVFVNKEEPVIIRFKGAVPNWALLPHIFMMFFGLWFVMVSAFYALAKEQAYKLYAILALISLFIGGLILGPIVQKFAFGEYWTGIPFGWDLTDNKTLVGFVAWFIAYLLNMRKERRTAIIIGAVFIIVIFSIPHSMHGSERNPETGEIISA